MIQNFLLKFSVPAWIFFILMVFIFGLTYLYYRKTVPPLQAFRRSLLTTLRGAILIIVLFLIFNPVLEISSQKVEKPVLAILLDNSASMKIKDPDGRRGKHLQDFILKLKNSRLQNAFSLRWFWFARNFHSWRGDSLTFREDGTDIGKSLRQSVDSLSSTNLQAIILASDGIYTQGSQPAMVAKTLSVPVYSILIGDSTQPPDIRIADVKAPAVSYQGKEIPVEVSFQQSGFKKEKTLITIRDGKKVVARKTVTLPESGFEKTVKFSLIPHREGNIHYRIQIQPLPGEVTRLNNTKMVSIKVLKSKIKVLVISGAPNFDRQFLSYLGSKMKDFEFRFLTQDNRGGFYEGRWEGIPLDSQDVFILQGFPTPSTRPRYIQALFKQIKNKKPVFWWITKNMVTTSLKNYQDWLPFHPFQHLVPVEKTMTQLTAGGNIHPVTKIDEDASSNQILWRDLPPVESFPGIRYQTGVQTLLQARIDQSTAIRTLTPYPILTAFRARSSKQLVLAAADVGFWYFQLQEDPLRSNLFLTFLERSLRWLVNREDIQQVHILPAKSVFNVGEAVYFSGQVYDEFYNPIKDATVTIKITGDTMKLTDEMVPEGDGYYSLQFRGLPVGNFSYEILAKKDDQKIGISKGKIQVIPFYLEFQRVAADAKLMREIARNSGGKFFANVAQFEKNIDVIKPQPRKYLEMKEIRFNDYLYWLFFLIAFLSAEWFFRKRWGLL